jgi:hypothetical protein
MRYMLLIYSDHEKLDALSPEEYEKGAVEFAALTQSLAESGELVAHAPLRTDVATTVRLQDGAPVPSDGPFAETKEHLCGFYMVDCADLDRAIEIAGRIPTLPLGSVEVRPVIPTPDAEGS